MKNPLIDPFLPAKGAPPQHLLPFLRWALRGSGVVLGLAAIASILAGVVEVGAALILGRVIDSALESGAGSQTSSLLLVGAFFLLLRPVIFVASAYTQSMLVGPNVFTLVLSRLHRYTLGHSVSFFDDDFAGRIAQKEMQTARAVTDVVIELVHTVLFALASVVGAVLMLGSVDWRIAILLAIWLVGYLLMVRFFLPKVRARSKERAAERAMVTGQVVDTVTNIKTVKLFAHADREDQVALGAMGRFRDASLAFGRVSVTFRLCLTIAAGLLPFMLLGAALFFWSQGMVSAGQIATTGAVSLRLSQMTGWVSFTLMAFYANIGEVEDGMRTLTPEHKLSDPPNATDAKIEHGSITFDTVSFSYGRENGGVENISLEIAAGEKLGIVGASGAGKSTLVSLLLRLYEAEKGHVRVDGQDVNTVTQASLRRQIGMVTQETAMFNRSARDNILYGNPDATEADMIAAAQRAEAHDFILGLEDHKGRKGYEAHLGERGVKLSGGQRQRIALARAILKDAPILVLDEATSALDSEAEAAIQAALHRVIEGKTVLAIAHRLSTLSEMDRIIVLDQGQIVESGPHEALLAQGGLYAQYWNRQSGGFIRTEAAE